MLKKVFRYEWKAFYKMPVIINICILVITLFGILSMFTPFWSADSFILIPFRVISVLFYVFLLVVGPLAVLIMLAVRYYKNLYTDEAYLTHTLPVTPRQHLIAKISVGYIWVLITGVVVFLSVISLLAVAMIASGFAPTQYEVSYFFEEFNRAMKEYFYMGAATFYLYMFVSLIFGCFFSIIMIYSSITLGQMFTGHRILGAVIWYIAEYSILQFISTFTVNVPMMFGSDNFFYNSGKTFNITMAGSILTSIIGSIVLYIVTEKLLSKKLNLD